MEDEVLKVLEAMRVVASDLRTWGESEKAFKVLFAMQEVAYHGIKSIEAARCMYRRKCEELEKDVERLEDRLSRVEVEE